MVRAPERASTDCINQTIETNLKWINKKIQEIRSKPQAAEKKFVNGENFLYLGNYYKLKIIDNRGLPFAFENEFFLNRRYQSNAKNLFVDWYKKKAKKIILQRVSFYSKQTGLKCKKIRITNAKSRWGSCSAKNNLNFAWRLIMAPLLVIDYVVVHELAHSEHKNHSQKFWEKVNKLFPEFKTAKKWLKQNGYLLKI